MASGPAGVGQQPATQPSVSIASGSVISGTVTASDAKGNITLESAAVKMVLQSAVQLPRNAQVTVRVEQPLTSGAMPSVRILTVDGKPVGQYIQQIQQNPPQPQQGNAAPLPQNPLNPGEMARPTAQVVEISARPAAEAVKTGVPENPAQAIVNTRAAAATQLSLSAVQTLPAVLLRPLLTAKTAEVLNGLSAPLLDALGKPLPAAAQVAPLLTQPMLRPGLQLQVRIVDLPATTPAQPSAPTMGAAPVSTPSQTAPAAGVAATPSIAQPLPTTSAPTPATGTVTLPTTTPTPIAEILDTVTQKAAFAAYAKQPPAPLNMGSSTPPAPLSTTSTPQPPQPQTAQSPAAPPPAATPLQTSPASAAPQLNPTAQPQAPATPALAQPGSAPATPLSPASIEQSLVKAEGKGLPAGQMAAVVIGKEQAGTLTVQTRLGLFTIPAPQGGVNLQPGAVITWQVRQVTQLPQQSIPLDATAALTNASQIGRAGSAFQEMASLLQTMQGAAAAQTLQKLVPHAGGNLSAGILLFMSVVKKGDIGSWLGKDIQESIESSGKGDLLQRLGGELTTLRSLFGGAEQQQASNNWQAMFLPVMVGKELETAQLFVKQDGKNDKEGEGGKRFVLELSLSSFGPMQMDGLVKKREGQSQFNLVIRTVEDLPNEVRTEIYSIFEISQKAAGMDGGLTFRTVNEFPVNPLEEIQAAQARDGSILA